jgi:hypothetical protein
VSSYGKVLEMEPYERILDSAQSALERRDEARYELAYMLEEDGENVAHRQATHELQVEEAQQETWSQPRSRPGLRRIRVAATDRWRAAISPMLRWWSFRKPARGRRIDRSSTPP